MERKLARARADGDLHPQTTRAPKCRSVARTRAFRCARRTRTISGRAVVLPPPNSRARRSKARAFPFLVPGAIITARGRRRGDASTALQFVRARIRSRNYRNYCRDRELSN